MGFPTLNVFIDFNTTNPLNSGFDFTHDITQYVRRVETRRGRQHELDRMEAGTATIVLDNRDRRFDPTNASSPYYPKVVPMKRIRIRGTWNGLDYTQFFGLIEDWGLSYDGPNDAIVTVAAVDYFKLAALFELAVYSDEVLNDSPVGYWKLIDPSGTTALEEAGHSAGPYNGTYNGSPALGAAGPSLLHNNKPSRDFDGVNDYVDAGSPAALKIGGDVTVEFLFKPELGATAPLVWGNEPYRVSWIQNVQNRGQIKWQYVRTDGEVREIIFPTNFDGSVWHHVALVRQGKTIILYKNGPEVSRGTLSNTPKTTNFSLRFCQENPLAGYWKGAIAYIAIYDKALSPDRIAAHYAAQGDVTKKVLTGAHIDAILTRIGTGSGFLQFTDAGVSTIQETTLEGNALEVIQRLVESENGVFFWWRNGSGWEFIERHGLFKPPYNTSQGTFGDDPSELPYIDLKPSFDDGHLYSRVRVERDNGIPQQVEDATTKTKYGPRTFIRSGLLIDSDAEALDAANYLLGRFKEPALRFSEVKLSGRKDDDLWIHMLGREIADRITVNRRPPGGGLISQECHIEGIAHTIEPGQKWETTWILRPADELTYWVLDDAESSILDSTTVLGY